MLFSVSPGVHLGRNRTRPATIIGVSRSTLNALRLIPLCQKICDSFFSLATVLRTLRLLALALLSLLDLQTTFQVSPAVPCHSITLIHSFATSSRCVPSSHHRSRARIICVPTELSCSPHAYHSQVFRKHEPLRAFRCA